jgi:uncharacterized membrane protein YgcG
MAGDGEELGLLGGEEGEEVPLGEGAEDQLIEEGSEETPGEEGGGAGGGEEEETLGGEEGGGSRSIVKLEPLAIRKALREITTQNPDFAKKFPTLEKAVTTALFKSGQIEKFGGVQAISSAIEALELYGGAEEIQEKLEELELHRDLEKGFERGDPKVIDGWAKDYPAGFKKLIVPSIDKLETLDKTYFEAVASYVIEKAFHSYGVFNAVAALGEALSAGKNEDAVKHFNSLAKFLGTSRDLAKNARVGGTDRDAELDEERSKITKTKREMLYSSARMDVNPRITFEMNRLIRLRVPRGTKVKVEQANRLRKEIQSETRARMNSESDFAENFEALLKAGNKDRLVKFIYTRALKHLPKVVNQLLSEFGLMRSGSGGGGGAGGNGARRTAGGGTGGSGGGARTVTGRPKTSEIDFTKTDKSYWLANMNGHGTAWLLNGKQAKW